MVLSQKQSFPVFAALASALGLVLSAPALAQDRSDAPQPDSGFYIGIKGGVISPSDETFSGVQDPQGTSPGVAGAPAEVAAEFGEGETFSGVIGYRLGTRAFGIFEPSIEAEYNYASSNVTGGSFNGGNQTFGGDVDINTFTIGYRSDIRWSEDQRVIPFTGGAIGIAEVDSNITYFPNNGVASAPTFAVQGSDTGFVLQSNLGVSFRLSDTLDLDLSARYQRINGLDLERRFVVDPATPFNANVSGRLESVSGLAGLRYRF
jgi:opacity protein-like surface antigen